MERARAAHPARPRAHAARRPADRGPRAAAWAALSAEPPPLLQAAPVSTFSLGRARGLLLGGNLSILSRLVGTPFLPSLSGAVLFFEDVGERPYRLDRLWTHLALAHAFDGVRGIAVGDLTGCEEKDADYRALDVVGELVRSLGVPAVGGFRVGHGDVNEPLPLGAEVELDADRGSLTFLEGAVG